MSNKKEGLFSKLVGMRTLRMGFDHTKDMLKSLKQKDPNLYIKETFDEALDRLDIPLENREAHLINVYKNLKLSFIMLLVMSLLFLVVGVSINFYNGNILAALSYSSLVFAFVSVMANNSFRCYQIRIRELGGVKSWLKNYKEWYPSSLGKAWNKN